MVQLTPQSRIFLATEPVDFRKGIDGLASLSSATARPQRSNSWCMTARASGSVPNACPRDASTGGPTLRT